MSDLVFLDTETTGLSLTDDIWEFAAVRRTPAGIETELHLFLPHDELKCANLPEPFLSDHLKRFPSVHAGRTVNGELMPLREAAEAILAFLAGRPHVVGAVPNFDTERIAKLFRSLGLGAPPWHYHLIDVESLAVGYLAGLRTALHTAGVTDVASVPQLPWDSDELSRAVGVEPPTDERHTAMGDARWAMALYDEITAGAK